MTAHTEGWLIVKRDLYFRPDCKGYTGIRDQAGRYSLDFAKGYECEGTSIIHESEAPEFREAAYSDLVIKHLIQQRDDVRKAERKAYFEGATSAFNEAADVLEQADVKAWPEYFRSRRPCGGAIIATEGK
jgi:hypothetical protein